jgi:DNA topoisomerase IA
LQSQLIQAVEPVYITMLAESKDSMVQTTMTKHWIDKLDEINHAITEHETMVSNFNKKHEQLRILESKL